MNFKIHIKRINKLNNSIVLLLGILPIIDSINGIKPTLQVGMLYKAFLCLYLFWVFERNGGLLRAKILGMVMFIVFYIMGTIFVNVLLGGRIINMDYPFKLIFNIILMCLMIENINVKNIKGKDIYDSLNIGCWTFLGCYLIPYLFGMGNTVYGGEMGFKAFFISQNELSFVIIVLTFYVGYRIICNITFSDCVKLALLFLCGILLNTKSTIIVCLFIAIMVAVILVIRQRIGIKVGTIIMVIVGMLLLKDKFMAAVVASLNRYSSLKNLYYDNSALTAILSGRNIYVKNAWDDLNSQGNVMSYIFGNGFCGKYLTEMDLVDIFFYTGAVGIIITIICLVYIYKKINRTNRFDENMYKICSFIIIVAFMFFTGHVLFMAMSGCFFVLFCCFLISYKNE